MKIFALGMNYFPHDAERKKGFVVPDAPIVFTKADSSVLKDGKPFFIPDFMGEIWHEAEIVVCISRLGKNIPEGFAHRYYEMLTVGIDFTAMDMLKKCRAEGLPWDLAKGFDGASVLGEWISKSDVGSLNDLDFSLKINGKTVQHGFLSDLIYSIDHQISYLSRYYTLKTGDLIFTGTPEGVGPVNIRDRLEGYMQDRKVLDFYCR